MSSLETHVTQCWCKSSSPGRHGQALSSADTCSQGMKKSKADAGQGQRKAFNKSKRPQIQSEMLRTDSALLCSGVGRASCARCIAGWAPPAGGGQGWQLCEGGQGWQWAEQSVECFSLFLCSFGSARCRVPDNTVHSRGKLRSPAAHCWSHADLQTEEVWPPCPAGSQHKLLLECKVLFSCCASSLKSKRQSPWEPAPSSVSHSGNLQQQGYFKCRDSVFWINKRFWEVQAKQDGDGQLLCA